MLTPVARQARLFSDMATPPRLISCRFFLPLFSLHFHFLMRPYTRAPAIDTTLRRLHATPIRKMLMMPAARQALAAATLTLRYAAVILRLCRDAFSPYAFRRHIYALCCLAILRR